MCKKRPTAAYLSWTLEIFDCGFRSLSSHVDDFAAVFLTLIIREYYTLNHSSPPYFSQIPELEGLRSILSFANKSFKTLSKWSGPITLEKDIN